MCLCTVQPYHPAPAPHAAHPPAKPQHEGPPGCSLNTTAAWCLEDAEYPGAEISHAIEYNYAGVAALYKVNLRLIHPMCIGIHNI